MRLERGTTQDMGELSNRYRGKTWLFYIHDDNPEALEAVEDILCSYQTGYVQDGKDLTWGDDCDGCPCYKDGFGCGFWIDIDQVPLFKQDFREAKKKYKEMKKASK